MNMNDPYKEADLLASAIEHALTLQRAADKALEELRKTKGELSHIARSMPGDVQRVIEQQLNGAADEAARRLDGKLKGTLAVAAEATRDFERIRRWLKWQAWAFAVGLFALMFAALVLAPRLMVPSADELQSLRAERDALLQNNERLRQAGVSALLAQCKDERGRLRPCVKVDDRQVFEGGYRVLKGF